MQSDRELMQQALDALGAMQSYAAAENKGLRICDEAIEALRARLSQPEQGPVAWRFYEGDVWCYVDHLIDLPQNKFEPLYTAQPQQHSEQWWKHEVSNARAEGYEKGRASVKQEPEADVCCQDFEKCVRSCTPRGQWIAHVRCGCGDQIMPDDGAECGNCVTARNAVKPQPVAQVHVAEDYYPHVIWAEGINAACFDQEYLYITPPQREFIGLTDEEMMMIYGQNHEGKKYSFGRAIEAKLKEKNHDQGRGMASVDARIQALR